MNCYIFKYLNEKEQTWVLRDINIRYVPSILEILNILGKYLHFSGDYSKMVAYLSSV